MPERKKSRSHGVLKCHVEELMFLKTRYGSNILFGNYIFQTQIHFKFRI